MIYNDVQNQLQLLIKVSAPPLIEVAESTLQLPQLVPGQRLQATVLASLPNGRFQVLIGDNILDLNLPKNTQPGERLDLTYVSNQPRLTFALTSDIRARVASLPAQPSVSISDSAKFLGALLQKVSEQAANQATSQVKLSPLLSGAPASTQDFAKILQSALSQSGLFYESHQAQWVAGERPVSDLLQEPQGKLSTAAQVIASPLDKNDALQKLPVSPASDKVLEPSDVFNQDRGASKYNTAALNVEQRSVAQTPLQAQNQTVNPSTTPLIQQQLEALDTRQLVWQGQVWPGQEMHWEIEEEGRKGGSQDADVAAWKTNLHLNFPNLGDVTASLALSPQGIRLSFNVAEASTANALKINQSDLLGAMHTAGLNLINIAIEHEKT